MTELKGGDVVAAIQQGDEIYLQGVIQEMARDEQLRASLSREDAVWTALYVRFDEFIESGERQISRSFFLAGMYLSAFPGAADHADKAGLIGLLVGILHNSSSYSVTVIDNTWRLLSNLAQTLDRSMFEMELGSAVNQGLQIAPVPVLRLVEADTRRFHTVAQLLSQAVFQPVVELFESSRESNAEVSGLVEQIFENILKAGNAPTLLGGFELGPDTNSLQLALTVFKLVDLVLTNTPHLAPDIKVALALSVRSHFQKVAEKVIGYVEKPRDKESVIWWALLINNLDTLNHLAIAARKELIDTGLVADLVKLLVAARKLPAVNKVGGGDHELKEADFPMIKSSVLPLLAVLVEGNQEKQNEVRELGGLAATLEACVIDANNPFAREKAIILIRYLLENNLENQNFVAGLEAKEVVNADALAQAGYETELVDGKFKLKKAPAG